MSAQLGEALTSRQLLRTGACFLAWLAVERRVAGPLLEWVFGRELWASRTGEQKHRSRIGVVTMLFSPAAVLLGAYGLLFPDATVLADPIYGRSVAIQTGAPLVVGFFLWNLVTENVRAWAGWPNFVHHLCCVLGFVLVQHPFSARIACVLLLFEASTPALCTFNILRHFGMEHLPLYHVARVAFAVLFFVFRLALGIPLTVLWYYDMLALTRDSSRQIHSAAVFYLSLVMPIPFLAINVFWFGLIVRGALKKGHRQSD